MLSHSLVTGTDEEPSSAEVLDAINRITGLLPQVHVDYEAEIKTLWATIAPEPKPVMTFELLQSLDKLQNALVSLNKASRAPIAPIRFLAYRAKGPLYTLGGDLDFYLECIAKGDRQTLTEYARVSIEGIIGNASCLSGTAITMASIAGKGMGGGIDAALSCNVVIAEEQASFSYPEVHFNHFPITASTVLANRIGTKAALKILTSGIELTAAKFEELGALEMVVPKETGEAWLRKFATETLRIHRARMGLYAAFYRQRAEALRSELEAAGQDWVNCLMRMSPLEISRLQRISAGQDRMLQHFYASIRAQSPSSPTSTDHSMTGVQ